MCCRWSVQQKALTATVTPPHATYWTFCYRSRRTPIPAPALPPLAPWVQDRAPDPAPGQAQDQVQAAEHQPVEPLAAEQVSGGTQMLDKKVFKEMSLE